MVDIVLLGESDARGTFIPVQIAIRPTSSSDLIASAIVYLGGTRAFARSHGLSFFQCAAGLEVGRDASCTEGVTADPNAHAEFGSAALDHAPGINPRSSASRSAGSAPAFGKELIVVVVAAANC
jgi:hypothetical protein